MKLSFIRQESRTCLVFSVTSADTSPFEIFTTPVGFALPKESQFAAGWCFKNKRKLERGIKKHRRHFVHNLARL